MGLADALPQWKNRMKVQKLYRKPTLVMNDQKGDTPMLPVIITETPRRVLSNSIVYNHVAYIDVYGDY